MPVKNAEQRGEQRDKRPSVALAGGFLSHTVGMGNINGNDQSIEKPKAKKRKAPKSKGNDKKKGKSIRSYDKPYQWENGLPHINEFEPDNDGRITGSISAYLGHRLTKGGQEVRPADDFARPRGTYPFAALLGGSWVDMQQVNPYLQHEKMRVGQFP